MPTELAFVLYHLGFFSISLLQENTASDFNDLGRKLIGGFVAAVIVAVAFAFINQRMRDKKPPAQFISISSFQESEETPKVRRD